MEILTAGLAALALSQTPPAPSPQQIAPTVWLVPGSSTPPRQPDGNTVLIVAAAELAVIDTGRHAWHRQAIEEFADSRDLSIGAILNTHWHLDHISGNRSLKAAYPGVRVYGTDAIDGAVDGFLRRSAVDSAAYLAQGRAPPELADDIRGDIASIEAIDALKPDVSVTEDRTLETGGRMLQLRVAARAATEADLWIHDPVERLVIVGDLVTLPAPFLDTACPAGWRAALDAVAATPFDRLVPGHGPVLNRDQFEVWRTAFSAFVDCGASQRPAEDCAADWTRAVRPLLADEREAARSTRMAAYYVGALLRSAEARDRFCGPPA